MTLEKIKDRFVEKEYRKETKKSSKFVKSDKTLKFIKDSVSEKKAEYRAYGRFIPKGPGYLKNGKKYTARLGGFFISFFHQYIYLRLWQYVAVYCLVLHKN